MITDRAEEGAEVEAGLRRWLSRHNDLRALAGVVYTTAQAKMQSLRHIALRNGLQLMQTLYQVSDSHVSPTS